MLITISSNIESISTLCRPLLLDCLNSCFSFISENVPSLRMARNLYFNCPFLDKNIFYFQRRKD